MSARIVPMTEPTDLADEEELELVSDDDGISSGRDDYPFFTDRAQKKRAWLVEKLGNSELDYRSALPTLQAYFEWIEEGKLPRQKPKPKVALVKDD